MDGYDGDAISEAEWDAAEDEYYDEYYDDWYDEWDDDEYWLGDDEE